jgi:predicted phosphodiesterase
MSKNRFYTNRQGVVTEITNEHLKVAVKLKIELQKLSSNMRCNWKTHKKMMEQEGYYDSDTNEAYRCLVKDFQRENGLLPSVSLHNDMVADSKLASLDRLLGELYFEKREAQLALQEINKFKKEFHLNKAIADEVVKEFKNLKIEQKANNFYEYNNKSLSEAILVITDWHIGLIIDDVKGNSFNLEVAKARISKLKEEAVQYCRMFNVDYLHVCMLGDAIEHTYMRNTNQAFGVELNFAQQVVKSTQLIIELLLDLSQYVFVEYEGIAGNHDRSNGDKNANIDGDNAVVIINESVKNFIRYNGKNIAYSDNDAFANEIIKEINGKKIKLVHGDEESRNSSLNDHISMDNVLYDCLVKGHLHYFNVNEENNGRLVVQVGTLSGTNNYAKKLKCSTEASQAIIIVKENGDIIPIKIALQKI